MTRELLLDGRPLQSRSAVRGIGTYVRGLLDGLHDLGVDERVGLVLARGGPPPRDADRWHVHAATTVPTLPRRVQPSFDPLALTWALARRRPALYHATEWAQPLRASCPVVITVYDLIPFLFGHPYRWMRRERWLPLRQLRHADAVIAISESTRRDVVEHAGVDPARVTVTPLAPMHGLAPVSAEITGEVLRRQGIRGPYLLGAGTFDSHKRLPLLLDVARRVRESQDVRLVLTGDQGPYLPRVRAEIEASGLADAVHLLGHVSRADLAALYSGTDCLLFTSAYEGFGIPVLEAMRCGAPVACFDNSSLPEVAGAAGLVAPEGDAGAMAAAVAALLGDPAGRRRRIEAGREWSAQFTWERTARQTCAVYNHLLTTH